MKEIGGYFELEQITSSSFEYHQDAIRLNLGRNALVYLIRAKNIQKIYLPYFLCDSVENVCKQENVDIEKYHLKDGLKPEFELNLSENEYLYIVNYYGMLSNQDIKHLQKKYRNIIVDNVQAFFQKPVKGVDTIYSCRKFFGVPDGAYLYTTAKPLLLKQDVSVNRFDHLEGRKVDGAKAHYQDFLDAEAVLNKLPILSMSNETQTLLRGINYQKIREKRNKNFQYLKEHLDHFNEIHVEKISGPFCYPLQLKEGQKLRKILIENNVFVPTLWPNLKDLNQFEINFVQNTLPLPCDQRYTIRDMKHIIKLIEEYQK